LLERRDPLIAIDHQIDFGTPKLHYDRLRSNDFLPYSVHCAAWIVPVKA
jgi:hypothetical protein